MAEKNVLLPANSSSSDGSVSEDSWTFLDEFDDAHPLNNNNESVAITPENDAAENLGETIIENATEAVALNCKSVRDAVINRNVDTTTGVEPQRYARNEFNKTHQ